jgi:hypothetical protein
MNYTKISRELLESMNFRPFTKNDFYGFAGVSSPCPFIGELEAEGIMVIVDGDAAELYVDDGSGGIECVDTCENIRELPYKTAVQLALEQEIAEAEASLNNMKKLLSELK